MEAVLAAATAAGALGATLALVCGRGAGLYAAGGELARLLAATPARKAIRPKVNTATVGQPATLFACMKKDFWHSQ